MPQRFYEARFQITLSVLNINHPDYVAVRESLIAERVLPRKE